MRDVMSKDQDFQNKTLSETHMLSPEVRKLWVTPAFTMIGELKDAKVNNKNPKIDFKRKGNKNPPGQGS